MKRVYIAGKYSDKDIIDILANIRVGIEQAAYLIQRGIAVFCPFLDFQLAICFFGAHLKKEHFQNNSMAWVEASDALLVLPGWETSKGTIREIARARELNMPIFYDTRALIDWVEIEKLCPRIQ